MNARAVKTQKAPTLRVHTVNMGNSASTAQLKVERAEKTGVLSLRDAGAEKVPEKIFKLANLRVLDLSHNRLPALPGAIGGLAQLTQLTLDRNRLKALPDVLCRLVKLESLSASENQLAQLPAGIGALVKLKKLNVSKNALLFLPPSLEKCAALQEVDVSHNQIAAFVNWAGLASLRDLNLSYNPIPELPSTSAAGLKRLKDLDLRGLDGLEGVPVGLLRDTPLERDGLFRDADAELRVGRGLQLPHAAEEPGPKGRARREHRHTDVAPTGAESSVMRVEYTEHIH